MTCKSRRSRIALRRAAYQAIKKYTMGKVKSKSKGKKSLEKWHEDVGAKLDILESQVGL